MIFPSGIKSLISHLPDALEDGSNELSPVARYALADLAVVELNDIAVTGVIVSHFASLNTNYTC